MPHMSSNISSTMFYGSITPELLHTTTRHTLRINDFIPRASDFFFFSRMIAQGKNRATTTKQLKKVFYRYTIVFKKFSKLMRK